MHRTGKLEEDRLGSVMGLQRIAPWAVAFLPWVLTLLFAATSGAAMLEIRVKGGEHYTHVYEWGIYHLRLIPLIAIWAEDENEDFIAHIYINNRSATSMWVEGRNIGRPAALPVWLHKQGIKYEDRAYVSDGNDPFLYAVASATPQESLIRRWDIPKSLSPGKYVIKAEINHAYDYNDRYQKDLPQDHPDFNAENGQPSVIWKGEWSFGLKEERISLSPYGHGHPLGKDGKIYTDMDGITDALKIVESVEAEYMPGR